jgi:hypothetical protein
VKLARSSLLLIVLAAGCGRTGDSGASLDLGTALDMRGDSGSDQHDLSAPLDFSLHHDMSLRDLATAPDFASAGDLATPPDLALPRDLTTGPDLAPPAIDLAGVDMGRSTTCSANGTPTSPQLYAAQIFDVCGGARVIRSADLDRDGRSDLVVACTSSLVANVQVMLSGSDGTPRQTTNYLFTMAAPQDLAIADVDGDGLVDIVFAGGMQLGVLKGHGDGTFSDPQTPLTISSNTSGMTAGDFNGDGYADVAIVDSVSALTAIYLGSANGLVDGAQYNGIGGTGIVSADLNRDGYIDLALAQGYSIAILRGAGNGTFAQVQSLSTPVGVTRVAAGDFNGDGNIDLAFVSPNWVGLTVSFADNNGKFGSVKIVNPPAGAPSYNELATADLDGDGMADILAVPGSVWFGRSDGSFSSSAISVFGDSVRIADINGDGYLDAAFASTDYYTNGQMPLIFGVGGGRFRAPFERDDTVFSSPIIVADVNGDGANDVLSTFNATLKVALGGGDGTMSVATDQSGLPSPYAHTYVVGDVNNDGAVDIVSSSADSSQAVVWVALGHGDGTFPPPYSVPVTRYERELALADMDGDGRLDLIAGDVFSGAVTTYQGHGDGTFAAGWDHMTSTQSVDSFAVGDVNRDGRPDIVAVTGYLETLINVGGGVFSQPIITKPPQSFSYGISAWIGDFDGDHLLDVAVGNSIYLGIGNGAFVGPITPSIPEAIAAVADFNHDGLTDLLSGQDFVSIYPAAGNGCFASPVRFSVPQNFGLGLGDLNSDGRTDIIASGFLNPRRVGDVLLNTTP